jgi:hypothetical protein
MSIAKGCGSVRKVIQIAEVNGILHALCDDGTIWALGVNGWVSFPSVPKY